MTRTYHLNAVLNFNIADESEYVSLRTKANNFKDTHEGKCDILSNEDADNEACPWYCRLKFDFDKDTEAEIEAIKTAIDNALPTLPTLTTVNGFELRYLADETQIAGE